MSRSSKSDSVYKISGPNLVSALDSHTSIMVSGPDQNNELSMLYGDDGSIFADSPQGYWRS